MNSELFKPLTKLTYVDLSLNVCIDEYFGHPTEILALQQTVDEKCGFDELDVLFSSSDQSFYAAELNLLKLKLNETEAKLSKTTADMENLEKRLNENLAEKLTKSQKIEEQETMISSMKRTFENLKSRCNTTATDKDSKIDDNQKN